MKLKYYLRGLGIGIVVSVFIMTVAFSNRQPMTDEEIKERASELGMIENSVLTDLNGGGKTEEDVSGEDKIENAEDEKDIVTGPEDNDEESEMPEDNDEETVNLEGDTENTAEPEDDDDKTETPTKETISITVYSGDSSWTVSRRMEEVGLIESAKDFDTHLCRYGYDKKISVGTYSIPKDANHEEMAKILTRMD